MIEKLELFWEKLSPEQKRAFDDIPFWDELNYTQASHIANGVRWVTFTQDAPGEEGRLQFSGGPVWEGSAGPEVTCRLEDAMEFANLLCGLTRVEDYKWGIFDEPDPAFTPGQISMMKAHATWARQHYPFGHPQHPDTFA